MTAAVGLSEQTGCQNCGASGYDKAYKRCSACGAPWFVGDRGLHWRTGRPPPLEFFARIARANDLALAVTVTKDHLRSHPEYPAWGRGVGRTSVDGRPAVRVSVQRPEHITDARRWTGDRANGFPIVFEAVGDLTALDGAPGCLRLPAWPQDGLLGDAAVWPSDVLAYRQQWEPFIAAHLNLWRYLNSLFEAVPAAQQCPSGIFTTMPPALDAATQQFCASLVLTRMRTSATYPGGILPQWNAWANASSAEILAGASSILKWHQDVVLEVGGPYKDDLVKIAKLWNIKDIELPSLPEFSVQSAIISRLEGDGLAAQGVLQILGYSAGKVLVAAANTAQAIDEGLQNIPKVIPNIIGNPWLWLGLGAVVTIVGSALVVHYLPAPERAH